MCKGVSCTAYVLNFVMVHIDFGQFLAWKDLLIHAPMGSPLRGRGVSRLSLPTPFSPIFVCPSAYRNLSPVLLFTHQLLPTYLQFSSSDCPFCLHRPFTYIYLLYKPSFATSFFLTHFQSLEVRRCLPSGRGENRASTHNDKHGWLLIHIMSIIWIYVLSHFQHAC